MVVTRERISRILELREILLSFQTGFNLVNDAVVCAILDTVLVTISSFSLFALISVLKPLVLFVISLVFSALISLP